MSSPSPVTMPAFEITESSVYVVRKGAAVLGQAASVSLQSQSPTRKIARLGDTDKSTSYQPVEHSVQLQLHSELDPDQMAEVLNGQTKPPSGGWVGTETLKLDPTVSAYDLNVDVYDGATGVSDTLMGTWAITNFKPSSFSVQIGADQVVTYSINGECDSIVYTPEAGVGA